MFALLALFLLKSHADDIYRILTDESFGQRLEKLVASVPGQEDSEAARANPSLTNEPPWVIELRSLANKFGASETRLRLERKAQKEQNWCLAIATFVGTLFWGFGDRFAGWLPHC